MLITFDRQHIQNKKSEQFITFKILIMLVTGLLFGLGG